MYMADGELIAVMLRGDRELNEIKLKNTLLVNELFMADEATVREHCQAGFGSLGPVGLKVKIYADLEITQLQNFSAGANQDDYHYINVNMGRDFIPKKIIDIRSAEAGDKCPHCGGTLQATRGIEAGHIFKLGTKYSDTMQASYRDQNGQDQAIVMGCYGIGISRTMAAAVEQKNDEQGIVWPQPIAPYQLIIVPVNNKKDEQMEVAERLYQEFMTQGIEVILDDRDERAGVKFKDADLIGIPVRITIGPKSLQENQVEVKKRWEEQNNLVAMDEVVDYVLQLLNR
jgi:prolyl-tRNA synthetase